MDAELFAVLLPLATKELDEGLTLTGLVFRPTGGGWWVLEAYYINSDGEWGHFARGGTLASQVTLALGQFNFDLTVGGKNRLTVWFGVLEGANKGVFLINDQEVAVLDLSFAGASAPGNVSVLSGLFPADEFNGSSTNFTDFTVYEKP